MVEAGAEGRSVVPEPEPLPMKGELAWGGAVFEVRKCWGREGHGVLLPPHCSPSLAGEDLQPRPQRTEGRGWAPGPAVRVLAVAAPVIACVAPAQPHAS